MATTGAVNVDVQSARVSTAKSGIDNAAISFSSPFIVGGSEGPLDKAAGSLVPIAIVAGVALVLVALVRRR